MTSLEWASVIHSRDELMIAICFGTIAAALNWYVWPRRVQEALAWLGVVLVAVTICLRLFWRG